MSSVYKSKKFNFTSIINTLDLKAETILLSENERQCSRNANEDLAKLRRMRRLIGNRELRSNTFKK
jgi:hypothetical protein